jgi:uncharacterized LabA/DUF88 family protein
MSKKSAPSGRGRIAIFIDASSLFHAAQQLGITIDYSKLLAALSQNDRLLRCFFYTGIDPTSVKQQGFLLWMRRNGFRVVSKPLTQLPDKSKESNVNVEIAVDMLSLAPYYDTAILVSGNGALAYAVNALSYQGIWVEIVGLRSMTSDSLLQVADRFVDLESLTVHIQKIS